MAGKETPKGAPEKPRDHSGKTDKRGRQRRMQRARQGKTEDSMRDYQTKEETFKETGEPEFHQSRKLDRMQEKAEKAGKKTEAARKKVYREKTYGWERVFDEKTGKHRYVLAATRREPDFKPESPVKLFAERTGQGAFSYAHSRMSEVEKENAAVEGAHRAEQRAEDVYHFVRTSRRDKRQGRQKKLERLERRQLKAQVDFRYRKFLEENPQMQEKTVRKQLQKRLQKRRIKRAYVREKQAGQAAKGTKEASVKSASLTAQAVRTLQEMAAKHASVLVTAGALAAVLIMLTASLSSCGAAMTDGISTLFAGSYLSEPAQIDAADLFFSELEMELQKEIASIETDYPDYDEYRYNLAPIGHDPHVLIGYLSAVHAEFTAADMQGEIQSLFDGMYELTLHPTEETRTRTVTKTGTRTVTDPVTGEDKEEEYEYEEEEEYTVTILEVTLTAEDLNAVVSGYMDGEQKELYALYNQTRGLVQQFYTPLDLYWYAYVSSYYGWRISPVTGAEQLHRGLDIAVSAGTAVRAAMDGTVTTAAYDSDYGNYVVIEYEGYCIKYAHLDSMTVSAGQTVTHGQTIGTTGNTGSSTGSHLHIECLHNGTYYNPLFYFEAGEGTLYGETPGAGGGAGAIPPGAYDDAAVQALMEEAARYLGYPYVWGGANPASGFDCSGFVSWVYTNSGVYSLPRTTAQGIYSQCSPVPAGDAKPGDIIFFTGTYHSGTPVTHVGIYCGNGVMIHAGDPVKYSNINTPYWQGHFYGFGRLP